MKWFRTIFVISLAITISSIIYAEPFSEPVNYFEEAGEMGFDSLNIRFVGNWPFGPAYGVAYDSTKNIAFCGSGGGVYILDVSDPQNPVKVSESIHTRGLVYDLFFEHNLQRLYIADGPAGLEIWDISDPLNPGRLGYCDTPGSAHGVFIVNEYAYIADAGSGLRVIDVSTPSNPQEVGHCNTYNRALNVYVSGQYAFIADDYNGGLRIIDVSSPSNPNEIGFYWLPEYTLDVQVVDSFAYVTTLDSIDYRSLRVINVSIPSNPQEIGSCRSGGLYLYVKASYAYVVEDGIAVIDISAPNNPIKVGHCPSHSGADVCVFGTYAYTNGGGLVIVDVSVPSNPQALGYYDTPGQTEGVFVSGPYAYITDLYTDGLRVIDVSSPSNPQIAGYCHVPGWAMSVYVSNSYAYVASGDSGLHIVDVSTPAEPAVIGSCDIPERTYSVFVQGSYAYVASYSGLRIIDVSVPTNPQEIGSCDSIFAFDVYVSGIYAYIIDARYGSSHLFIVDVSIVTDPKLVAKYYISVDNAYGVYVSGSYAFIATTNPGLLLAIDVSEPSNPIEVGSCDVSGHPRDVYVSGTYAYVSARGAGLRVVDISSPSNPQEVAYYDTPGDAWNVFASGSYAYIADYWSGLQIYENLLATGAKEEKEPIFQQEMHLVKNPIQGKFIEMAIRHNGKENVELSIYNILGQSVKSFSLKKLNKGINKVKLDIRNLKMGVYFLRWENHSPGRAVKIIVLK